LKEMFLKIEASTVSYWRGSEAAMVNISFNISKWKSELGSPNREYSIAGK